MGANTIRRYSSNIYDKNVLNITQEFGLKVVFGFWFDPQVDYLRDSAKVNEYLEKMEETVVQYKDQPSILAWSLGNETWGLLKHRFAKPYLTKVRQQYMRLIELMAERIHTLDPSRPVFSCVEHETDQLPGELAALHDGVPSVDVVGINSYYEEQISQLHELTYRFDPQRPYLVSEFGPKGYWDPRYNKIEAGALAEDNENQKSEWYSYQWKNYVQKYKGNNIGGFAYCWHDRMEGSFTWFGLTDYKGRLKPEYYSLRELWTGRSPVHLPCFSIQMNGSCETGKNCTFNAVMEHTTKQHLTYEWQLLREKDYYESGTVEYFDDGSSAHVRLPEIAGNYRLYLFASDDNGNVTTSSLPLTIEKREVDLSKRAVY